MAKLDGEELKKFNKLLDELNDKKTKLGQDKILDLDGTVENLGVVNQLLDVANENLNDLQGSVEGIRESWGSVIGELKKVDNLTGVSVKSFNKLSGIADKLSMSQKGLNELSSRQISSLITKTKIEEQNLIFQKKQLLAKGRDKDTSDSLIDGANELIENKKYELALLQKSEEGYKDIKKELNGQIKEQEKKIKIINEEAAALVEIEGSLGKNNGLIQQQINALKTQEKQTRNVERATGLTGAAMKGISGFLDKIGMSNMGEVFEDANLAAKATAERLTDGGKKAGGFITKIRAMGSAFKVVGKAILRNLTDPLVLAGMAMKAMKGVFNFFADAYKKGEEAAMRISDENVNMARSLGISQKAASKLAGSVAGMGPTTAASKASIEGIYKAMGSTEKLSRGTLKVFVKLNTMAGLSAESLAKFQKFAKKSGEDAGTLVSAMAKTAGAAIKNNKLAMTQRDLLDETANQSAYVKLQFAGQGPALVKAVAQSKALGLNMKQARDMASSLLNFEDSIAKEMEAELLIGRDLNLEEARALALKGDNVGAAKAIAEQVGSAADFMNLNVIAQQALAEAAGMGVDEMSNMLSGQQDMKAEGDDLVKNQEDGIKAMTSQVSLREAAENRARAAAEANISVYKELNGLVNTLKDTWNEVKTVVMESLAEKVIKPLVDFITSEEGKKFLKELPDRVDRALIGIVKFAKVVKQFATDHPWITKVLGYGIGGRLIFQITGLSTLVKILRKIGKFLGIKIPTPKSPKIPKKTPTPKIPKKIPTPKVTTAIMKGSGKKVFGAAAQSSVKAGSAINTTAKTANVTAKSTSLLSKAAPALTKTLKVLGPIGAIADVAMGGFKGAKQAEMSKEEQKAAGVKEGIGKVESTALGALTGGAEKGSMFSEKLGIEKGGVGDEALGIAMATARGALIGSMFGPIGTAVGAGIGGIAETFKVFSNPDSAMRKGLVDFANKTGEKISNFASSAGEKISGWVSEADGDFLYFHKKAGKAIAGWASSAGEKISGWAKKSSKDFVNFHVNAGKAIAGWASSAGEKISGWASSTGETMSGWASSAGETMSGWASSVKDKFTSIKDNIVGIISNLPGILKDKFISIKDNIVGIISNLPEILKDKFISIKDTISNLPGILKDKFILIKDNIVGTISSIPGKIIDKIKNILPSAVLKLLPFANGGIAPGGFQAFANGGVVTQPTLGLVGEGKMNEAIVPLPDGKSVPVKLQGGDSNNSSNAQVITLLKELITVVKSGGDVVLDGQKVGTALVAGSYRMQ